MNTAGEMESIPKQTFIIVVSRIEFFSPMNNFHVADVEAQVPESQVYE